MSRHHCHRHHHQSCQILDKTPPLLKAKKKSIKVNFQVFSIKWSLKSSLNSLVTGYPHPFVWVNKLCPCISRQHVNHCHLTPFIDVYQQVTQFAVVFVNQVNSIWANILKSHHGTTCNKLNKRKQHYMSIHVYCNNNVQWNCMYSLSGCTTNKHCSTVHGNFTKSFVSITVKSWLNFFIICKKITKVYGKLASVQLFILYHDSFNLVQACVL